VDSRADGDLQEAPELPGQAFEPVVGADRRIDLHVPMVASRPDDSNAFFLPERLFC
jgi:hypothetical protein